jgi:mannose-1-phosphate guanylyltransferase
MSAGSPPALAAVDVAVLAGGLGTRLRSVLGDELPKVLAPVGGRPFLEVIAGWLGSYGARRLVLCLGHLAGAVVAHARAMDGCGLEIVPVVEPRPLGTGGALRFAAGHLTSDPVLVMNGDSWVDADLAAFVAGHRAAGAFLSMLCVEVPDASRYGRVDLAADGTVARFREKEPDARPGLINAGLYLLSRAALEELEAAQAHSLERDFLQRQAAGRVRAHVSPGGGFIDIGTPESLARAGAVIRTS